MPRCEYYEPNLLPGEREQPSIFVDSLELLKLMLRAEMMMTKVDRVRYADRAIKEIQDVRAEFRLAYDFEDDRLEHLKKMCAHAGNFIDVVQIIGEENAIRIKPEHETMTPDQMKLELLNRVAALDEGITKWRRSIQQSNKKGTTGGGGRTGSHPKNEGTPTSGNGGYE